MRKDSALSEAVGKVRGFVRHVPRQERRLRGGDQPEQRNHTERHRCPTEPRIAQSPAPVERQEDRPPNPEHLAGEHAGREDGKEKQTALRGKEVQVNQRQKQRQHDHFLVQGSTEPVERAPGEAEEQSGGGQLRAALVAECSAAQGREQEEAQNRIGVGDEQVGSRRGAGQIEEVDVELQEWQPDAPADAGDQLPSPVEAHALIAEESGV